MKIGIIGSRGIPNQHGGFEQFAEYLSTGLVKKGCEVWVYTSSSNAFKGNEFKGVKLIHCPDPEKKMGPFGQFIYDLFCILDSRRRKFDIIYQLGYTSSAIWNWLFNKKAILVTNTDGLEWQRSKYKPRVRKFLKYSEKIVIKKSDHLISDSKAIQSFTNKEYQKESTFISYGAEPFTNPDEIVLNKFNVKPFRYYLIISRLQSDNNIETIIKGHQNSETPYPLLIVGKINNPFAKNIQKKYANALVQFAGGIYEQNILNNLRHFSKGYFHGHSAGGTNPSLLEAMAAKAFICAHSNDFNKEVLCKDSSFFNDENDIAKFISANEETNLRNEILQKNMEIIKSRYSITNTVNQYYKFFNQIKKR